MNTYNNRPRFCIIQWCALLVVSLLNLANIYVITYYFKNMFLRTFRIHLMAVSFGKLEDYDMANGYDWVQYIERVEHNLLANDIMNASSNVQFLSVQWDRRNITLSHRCYNFSLSASFFLIRTFHTNECICLNMHCIYSINNWLRLILNYCMLNRQIINAWWPINFVVSCMVSLSWALIVGVGVQHYYSSTYTFIFILS